MAQMLVLIISDEDKMERILEEFINIGIRGATVIDSVGMGRILARHTPVFSSLLSMINGDKKSNKTVFAVSKHECKIQKAVEFIRSVTGDFESPDSGMLFIMPVVEAYGFAMPIDEKKC